MTKHKHTWEELEDGREVCFECDLPKPTHGGKRPGAGRPPTGDERMVQVTFSLPPALLRQIEAEALSAGISRSQAIVTLIQGALVS